MSPSTWELAAQFAIPLVISWLLTWLIIGWAPRLGLLDHPNARKVHTQIVPKGGGVAIFLAFVLAMPLWPDGFVLATLVWPDRSLLFLGLGLGVVGLGLVDDFQPLPWQVRLLVQAALAAIPPLVWFSEASWFYRALAVLWIVGLVNAFNMLDNMDALSGGVAWIVAGFCALIYYEPRLGINLYERPFVMLMGALTGFLWFNRPPARIFMGDAGSTFLGFFFGVTSLSFLEAGQPHAWTWLVPVCLLAVPLYDMTSVVILRLCQGRSPFHADKQHLSHRLVELGLSKPHAVLVIYVLAVASGLSGLVLYHVSDATGAALVVGQLGVMWAGVAAVEYVAHWKKARHERPM